MADVRALEDEIARLEGRILIATFNAQQTRRERAREAERRYREKNRERRLERGREMDRSEGRKQKKQEWRENNRVKVNGYTKKFLDKKRAEGGQGFRDREAERLRGYRKTEDYADYIDERKGDENYQWSVIKFQAKQRGKDFLLTKEEFLQMFQTPCFFCGEPLARGVDRKDNDLGYSNENCVSCCATCNLMKGVHSDGHFLQLCSHLTYVQGFTGEGAPFPEAFESSSGYKISKYKHASKIRNIPFLIDDEMYMEMLSKPCHYCGKEEGKGVDRSNSDLGYEEGNMVPACKTCNYMKRKMLPEAFLAHVVKITRWINCKNQ